MLVLTLSAALRLAAADGAIESVIDDEMPASGVPGVAYAVVADGEVESVGARGVVRVGAQRSIDGDTPFLLGSISKSFTALAVMQLVEAKEVELDAGISRYLEVFADRPSGTITVRQLLSHTSGYSTLQGNLSHEDEAGGADELERRVALAAALTPAYAPDTKWEYSNLNYQILGRLIEVTSEQDYQGYVRAHILEPLEMERSFVADGEVHPEMAVGHRPWFGSKRPLADNRTHRATAPQGGIVASASDLALYLQCMSNGRDDVLSAEGKAAMMRPASDASPFYGLGWFIDEEAGTVWHSGSSPGFETLATIAPAQRRSVAVLLNAGSGTGFAEGAQLTMGITAQALGQDYAGEGSRWSQKVLFVCLTLAPFAFVSSMLWAWRHRAALRAKSKMGAFGLFSLWFPLLTTLSGAVIIFVLVPRVYGVPLETLRVFQPDFGLVLIASALTGVAWAVLRLGVAYSGGRSRELV